MSKQNSKIQINWFQPIILGVIVIFMYATTLTYWHSGDDIQWILTVQSSVTGEPILHPASADEIINPLTTPQRIVLQIRYFLELPTLARVYVASRFMNLSENAVRPTQLTHAAFGTVGVVFFFLALAQFVSRRWSSILSLGLAFSFSWWYYSTHLDYTIISHAFSCLLFYLLASLCYSRKPLQFHIHVFALGIVTALTSSYLITGLLFIPVILVALLLNYSAEKARFGFLLYLSSVLLTILVVGSVVWITDVGLPPSWSNLVRSLTYSGASAHAFVWSDVPKTMYGFTKALLTYPGLGHQTPGELFVSSHLLGRASFLGWYALAMIFVLVPFVVLSRLYKQLKQHKNFAIILGVWFCTILPFGAYWEPSYIKWWTGALIPWWGLVGVLTAVTVTGSFLQKVWSVGVCTFIITMFGVNFLWEFRPNSMPNNNPWLEAANILGDTTGPHDLFISLENHPLDFYLPYFAQRHTLSYELVFMSKGQNRDSVRKEISEAIHVTTEQGGRIFLYNFHDQNINELREKLGFPNEHFEKVIFEGILTPDFIVLTR